jgi:membrane protease YdiL (CAAX protease family)
MFGACLIFFPLLWHKGFFAGIQWNGAIALKLRNKLFVIASICCALALANGLLLPGPKDAPIEKIFRSPGAAWLLFAFGVTIAPFFEELIFRGFLLPALCTGADWIAEKLSINSVPGFDPNGRPLWPAWAIRTAVAVYASIPLAVSGLIIYRHKWITVLAIFIYCLALLGFLLTLAFRRNPANMNPQFGSLDPTGHPLWSMPAMLIGSILTSLPFAAMHAAQTGYSWGPFVLLVGVSLVLCWARLSTRSLAASVFVHASYNFLLFTLMMLGTSGFRHMDKM